MNVYEVQVSFIVHAEDSTAAYDAVVDTLDFTMAESEIEAVECSG